MAVIVGGCSKDYLDPSQIGRFRPIPSVNIILDSLGVAEEAKPEYEGAEDPRPTDAIERRLLDHNPAVEEAFEINKTFGRVFAHAIDPFDLHNAQVLPGLWKRRLDSWTRPCNSIGILEQGIGRRLSTLFPSQWTFPNTIFF